MLSINAHVKAADAYKVAVPTREITEKAFALVQEIYGSEIAAAKTAEGKSALAQKLMRAGIDETGDVGGRYALLILAKEIAVEAGDLTTAFQATDETANIFAIDGPLMKADLAAAASRRLRTPEDRKRFEQQGHALTLALLRDDRHTLAKQTADFTLAAARATSDAPLVRKATALVQTVRDAEAAYAGVSEAIDTLNKSPSDPGANLNVGRYRCFVQGDWEIGLPMLALGSDAAIKSLAAYEITGPPTADGRVKLADGWWEAAEKEVGIARDQVRAHATYWYRQAAPSLTGLAKAKAEKRIKDVGPAAPGYESAKSETTKTPSPPADSAGGSPVNWISLTKDMPTFRSAWRVEDKRVAVNYEPRTQTVSIDGVYDIGGFDTPEPWEEVRFNLTVERLSHNHFEIKADDVVLKLDGLLQNTQNAEVRIVRARKDSTIELYLGNRRLQTGTILASAKPKTTGIRFASGGGQNAKINVRDFRYTTVAGAPPDGTLPRQDAENRQVARKDGFAFRSVELFIDADGKAELTVDSRVASATLPPPPNLLTRSELKGLKTASVETLPDGQSKIVFDFRSVRELSDLGTEKDMSGLKIINGRLLLPPRLLDKNRKDVAAGQALISPRDFRLPFRVKALLDHRQKGSFHLHAFAGGHPVSVQMYGDTGRVAVFTKHEGPDLDFVMGLNAVQLRDFVVPLPDDEVKAARFWMAYMPTEIQPPLAVHRIEITSSLRALINVQLANKDGRVRVNGVLPGPAANAGIQVGDVILSVNAEVVSNLQECTDKVGLLPIGKPVMLTLERTGVVIEKQVTPE